MRVSKLLCKNEPAGGSFVLVGYLQAAYFEGEAIGKKVAACVLGEKCHRLEHIERVKNSRPYNPK